MKKNYFLTLALVGVMFNGFAQQAPVTLWNDQAKPASAEQVNRTWLPVQYRYVHLDIVAMKNILATAPDEINTTVKNSTFIIELPMPDGNSQRFKIVYSPFMHRDLAAVFPEIKTFTGKGIDDASATIKCDYTLFGFHAYIISTSGTVYIDPANLNSPSDYLVYYKHDIGQPRNFTCEVDGTTDLINSVNALKGGGSNSINKSIGADLRSYRLALGCTHQYAVQFGTTKAAVLSEMNTAMNRVNGVYETEVCIHMTMVPNDTVLIFMTAAGDPYTNSSGGTMLGQNQTQCTSLIGSANYDIGHVFSTGGGGIAQLGCVCGSNKAQGVTGSPAPTTGDAFWIDYVAHEMGHQFGGNHTFNSTTSSCGGGNRSANAAYEPGSGITIMAYAGICGTDDLAPHSIAYFHTKSFDEIVNFSTTGNGNSCKTLSATGNGAPVLTLPANYTIPYKTPFRLIASSSDPDGDPVTYSWEEYDLGTAGAWNATPKLTAPLFRSYDPVSTGTRLCPKLTNILNAYANGSANSKGEWMADTSRSPMNWRCTLRDGLGGVTHNDVVVQLTVKATNSNGFRITSPNTTGISWPALSWQTITWDVAGSTANGINCANVNILLSTDGGQTFPYTQASNVPNSGSYSCNILNHQATTCRFMVEGAGNVFFDINDKNFTITQPVGIDENELSHYISVYPNPSDNTFSFAINNNIINGKVTVEVFDATGRKVTEAATTIFGSDNIISVDMNGFAKGIYHAVVKTNQGTLTEKLIKL